MKSNRGSEKEETASLIQRLRNELKVCAAIHHPYIVNIYDCFEDDKKVMSFQLNQNRKIDHKMLNLLKNEANIEIT